MKPNDGIYSRAVEWLDTNLVIRRTQAAAYPNGLTRAAIDAANILGVRSRQRTRRRPAQYSNLMMTSGRG